MPPPPPEVKTKRQLHNPLDLPIVHALYETYREWHQILLRFPKSQRHTLGTSCNKYFLGLLETIIYAAANAGQGKEKLDYLKQASIKLDILKLLIRLAKDCECISNQQYQQTESRLYETGKMLGGWIKSVS